MKSVLVLGGNGLLGSEIIKLSSVEFNFIKVDRNVHSIEELIERHNPVAIINSVASLPSADDKISFETNYEYPLRWIKVIEERNFKKIKWIQVSSYFELQQKYGRNDSYTKYKAQIRKELENLSSKGSLELTSIFMPYLTGLNERTNRIIPTLLNIPRTEGEVMLSSGTQYLPVLTASDAAKAVFSSLETDQLNCSATPVWYSSVKDLVSLVSKFLDTSRVVFNSEMRALDADFPKVDFPNNVKKWEPQIQLEEYLKMSAGLRNKPLQGNQ